jgi:hypothetical protein
MISSAETKHGTRAERNTILMHRFPQEQIAAGFLARRESGYNVVHNGIPPASTTARCTPKNQRGCPSLLQRTKDAPAREHVPGRIMTIPDGEKTGDSVNHQARKRKRHQKKPGLFAENAA